METMKVINLDDIRPADYESRINGDWAEERCIICGKRITPNDKNMVHMLPNGDITDSRCEFIPENAELGWWLVGNTCYKKFQRMAQAVPVKTWREKNDY